MLEFRVSESVGGTLKKFVFVSSRSLPFLDTIATVYHSQMLGGLLFPVLILSGLENTVRGWGLMLLMGTSAAEDIPSDF